MTLKMRPNYHFLDFHFLEGSKPTGPRLHMQGTVYTVFFALVRVLTISDWCELFAGHLLEGF